MFANWLQTDTQLHKLTTIGHINWSRTDNKNTNLARVFNFAEDTLFDKMSFVRLSCMIQELWAIFINGLQIDTDYKAHSESISFLSVDFLRIVHFFFFFISLSFHWDMNKNELHFAWYAHDMRSVKKTLCFLNSWISNKGNIYRLKKTKKQSHLLASNP